MTNSTKYFYLCLENPEANAANGFFILYKSQRFMFPRKKCTKNSQLALYPHHYRKKMQIEDIRIKYKMADIFTRHIGQLMSEHIL